MGLAPQWRDRVRRLTSDLARFYRFWRDLEYAIGALSAGIIADIFGFSAAMASTAGLTFLSGTVVAVLMREPKCLPRA